jgi:hypothetical protein
MDISRFLVGKGNIVLMLDGHSIVAQPEAGRIKP